MHSPIGRGLLLANVRLSARRPATFALLILVLGTGSGRTLAQQSAAPEHGLDAIRAYIASGWDTLTRSMSDCASVVDPKLSAASVLYIPAEFTAPPTVQQ